MGRPALARETGVSQVAGPRSWLSKRPKRALTPGFSVSGAAGSGWPQSAAMWEGDNLGAVRRPFSALTRWLGRLGKASHPEEIRAGGGPPRGNGSSATAAAANAPIPRLSVPTFIKLGDGCRLRSGAARLRAARRLLLQVHDETGAGAAPDALDTVLATVKRVMEINAAPRHLRSPPRSPWWVDTGGERTGWRPKD